MEEAESETGSDAWKIKVDKRRTTHVLHLQKKTVQVKDYFETVKMDQFQKRFEFPDLM